MSEIVLWSGGMDSTYMLFDIAITNPRDMVHAVTVNNIGFNNNQIKSEKRARKAIKKELKKRKITNIQYHDINVQSDFRYETQQAPLWFTYVMPVIKEGDQLNMAYLGSDGYSFFYFNPLLGDAFKTICKLRGIKAEINFLYQAWSKGDIIKKLKKAKLYRITSYCGQPKKNLSPCGKCMKCISVKRWSAYPDSGIST